MYTILDDLYTGLRDRLLEGFFGRPLLQPAFGYMMASPYLRSRDATATAVGARFSGWRSHHLPICNVYVTSKPPL